MLANKAKLIAHQFLIKNKEASFDPKWGYWTKLSDKIEALLNSNEVKTLHHKPINPSDLDNYYTAQVRRPTPAASLLTVYNDAVELGYYDMIHTAVNSNDTPQQLVTDTLKFQAYYHGAHGAWEQDGHTSNEATTHRHVLNMLDHYTNHIFYAIKLGLFI